jgi:hypothetical protein
VGVLGAAVRLIQHDLQPREIARLTVAFRQAVFGMCRMRKIVAPEAAGKEVAVNPCPILVLDRHVQPPARGRSKFPVGNVVVNPRPRDSTDLVDIAVQRPAIC